jgi:hypothetical protein
VKSLRVKEKDEPSNDVNGENRVRREAASKPRKNEVGERVGGTEGNKVGFVEGVNVGGGVGIPSKNVGCLVVGRKVGRREGHAVG